MKKIIKWFFISVITIVLLLFAAGALIINTSIKDKLIRKFSEPYLNAELKVDKVRVRFLSTLPDVSLTLCGTRLLREDTQERIASIDTLALRCNLFSCLEGDYEVEKVLVKGVFVDYRSCDSILIKARGDSLPEDKPVEKEQKTVLPFFSVDFQLSDSDISFLDLLSHARLDLSFTASNSESEGLCGHITKLKASAFDAKAVAKADFYRLLSEKALVDLTLSTDAELSSLKTFIPESILARGKVSIKADGTLTRKGADIFASVSSPFLEASTSAGKVEIRDFSFEAGAHEGVQDLPERKRPEGMQLPDFLKEEDFRKADISLQIDSSIAQMVRTWNPRAKIHFTEAKIKTPRVPLRNTLRAFSASANMNEVCIDTMYLKSGVSDISVTGSLKGISSMFNGKGKGFYSLDLTTNSKYINLNQLLLALDKGAKATQTDAPMDLDTDVKVENIGDVDSLKISGVQLVVIPANVKADVKIHSKRARFYSINARNLNARARMGKRTLLLSDVYGSTPMGSVSANAFYSTITKQDIGAGVNFKLENISVEKALDQMPVIDTLIPVLSSFKGNVNCELALTTKLDTTLTPIFPTASGAFRLQGDYLSLEQQGTFKKIAKLLLFKDRKKGVIEHLEICGVVHDNALTVFPFDLTLDRYSLALGGSQDFNGKFDYKVSLMRTPFLIRFGVNLHGDDFDHAKFRLIRSQFKVGHVPTFHDEVDQMLESQRKAILSSITKGSDKIILSEKRTAAKLLKQREGDILLLNTVEDLPEDQMSKIDSLSRVPQPELPAVEEGAD